MTTLNGGALAIQTACFLRRQLRQEPGNEKYLASRVSLIAEVGKQIDYIDGSIEQVQDKHSRLYKLLTEMSHAMAQLHIQSHTLDKGDSEMLYKGVRDEFVRLSALYGRSVEILDKLSMEKAKLNESLRVLGQ